MRAADPHAPARRERTLASPQFRDGRFHNLPNPEPPVMRVSAKTMWEFMASRGRRFPKAPLPVLSPLEAWRRPAGDALRATWLGHSTVLLELGRRKVLTDPVFGERASPLSFAGPRRFHPAPVDVEGLPPLDLIVLSHDHYDHLCKATLRKLARVGVPIVTALGVGARLVRLGWPSELINELDWGERVEIAGLEVTATPAQHFSGRGLTDRNRTLWASWVIASDRHKVFFSGDSGYAPLFAEIGQRHGPFDLVMLETGAFHPSWAGVHMGPENALRVAAELSGALLLPIHWGTFNLALHDWDEPAETLYRGALARGQALVTPRVGESFLAHDPAPPDPWWRRVASAEVEAASPAVDAAALRP